MNILSDHEQPYNTSFRRYPETSNTDLDIYKLRMTEYSKILNLQMHW